MDDDGIVESAIHSNIDAVDTTIDGVMESVDHGLRGGGITAGGIEGVHQAIGYCRWGGMGGSDDGCHSPLATRHSPHLTRHVTQHTSFTTRHAPLGTPHSPLTHQSLAHPSGPTRSGAGYRWSAWRHCWSKHAHSFLLAHWHQAWSLWPPPTRRTPPVLRLPQSDWPCSISAACTSRRAILAPVWHGRPFCTYLSISSRWQ